MASPDTGRPWGGQKLGAYLATFALIGWIVAMVTIQFVQAAQHGYGSGFGDGGRIPPMVVEQYGTSDREELIDLTRDDHKGVDGAHAEWVRDNFLKGGDPN